MKLLGALAVMVSDEVPMNGWRSMLSAALVVFATKTIAARAGTLGATSRDSVSISITILPHIGITPPQVSSSSGATGVCLSATGVRNYHINVLRPGPSQPDSQVESTLPPPAVADATLCGMDAAVSIGRTKVLGVAPFGQVTLLVVPD